MGSKFDDAKGRLKEAAGEVAENDELKREGKTDQMGAKAKEYAEKAKSKGDDAVETVKEKLHHRD